jgi:hypothetical protein
MGNFLTVLSVVVLMGPAKAFAWLSTPQRMAGGLIYLVSLLATLYCVVWLKWSYFALPVICGQVTAMGWFAGQFLPFSIPFLNLSTLRWIVCGACQGGAKVMQSVV